jgi:Ca2+:H+ antiporter
VEGSVIKRKINILLLAIPIVFFHIQILELFKDQLELIPEANREIVINLAIFVLAAAALIPLAGFVESAVEELAELLGPFVGGLLHTTFGNVAELTIGISILLAFAGNGGAEIVEGSIAGVIIRNSLLFLGMSTLAGCWRHGKMKFNAENAGEYSTVFALAVVGLSIPTIVDRFFPAKALEGQREAFKVLHQFELSSVLAIVLLVSYFAYIAFAVFRVGEGDNLVEKRARRRDERLRKRMQHQLGRLGHLEQMPEVALPDTQALFPEERETARERIYAKAGRIEQRRRRRAEHGEEGPLAGKPVLRGVIAALVLGIATAGVATMSEAFAESVKGTLELNPAMEHYSFFLGLILIPVLAGIVEFYGSVESARENRMEITMAVTAGASIQMILLVVPILVLVGAFTDHPLDLIFQPLNVIIFGVSTFIFMLLSRDGESTWLEGVQLCAVWLLVAITAFFLPPLVGG